MVQVMKLVKSLRSGGGGCDCRSGPFLAFEWQRTYRESGLAAPSFASGRPITLSDTYSFRYMLWVLLHQTTSRPGLMYLPVRESRSRHLDFRIVTVL